jgi:hypothetical protein
MKTTLRAVVGMWMLAGVGCATPQLAGSYVHEVYVDRDGRVTAVERCDLVAMQRDGWGAPRTEGVTTAGCRVTRPRFFEPARQAAAPVPAAPPRS